VFFFAFLNVYGIGAAGGYDFGNLQKGKKKEG